jgi:hypothetical protein
LQLLESGAAIGLRPHSRASLLIANDLAPCAPQVLATLPFELRSKILRHLYAGIIGRVPLLQAMMHDEMFLTDVCVRLQHYTCSRDSFVYQRGEWHTACV